MTRVRLDLSDGAFMDASISEDASHETFDALRVIGEAAAQMMREEVEAEAEAVEQIAEILEEERLGFEP